ncbi:hypothetical protein Fcan01_24358 [Folsomia candida]|uniref:Uncharacterized protein n=1 Tax=Folsomia candida TaxID=158441 RepID=A0A226D6Z2_FOLCA|nr:hypothetical protein Fcan01_24358 [Folsomia candida]
MSLGLYNEQKVNYGRIVQRIWQEKIEIHRVMQNKYGVVTTGAFKTKAHTDAHKKREGHKTKETVIRILVQETDDEEEEDDESTRTPNRRGAVTAASPLYGMRLTASGLMMHSVLQQWHIQEFDRMQNPT